MTRPPIDIAQELLSVRYNAKSELVYTVEAGNQTRKFDLKSK